MKKSNTKRIMLKEIIPLVSNMDRCIFPKVLPLSALGEIPSAQPTLFEYFFDTKQLLWVPWLDVVPEYVHNPETKFSEILVPTVDTVRTTWLLELMVTVKRPVVLVGETGTSKSATTANFLRGLDKDSTVGVRTITV